MHSAKFVFSAYLYMFINLKYQVVIRDCENGEYTTIICVLYNIRLM